MGKSKKHEKKSKKKSKHKERKGRKHKKHLKEKRKGNESPKHGEEKKRKPKQTDCGTLNDDFSIPVELMNNKSHAPETPEEYQRRQDRIRREIDPITGRSRLIKGDGEVLEEIVSKDRHKIINKEATKRDGEFFQENTLGKR